MAGWVLLIGSVGIALAPTSVGIAINMLNDAKSLNSTPGRIVIITASLLTAAAGPARLEGRIKLLGFIKIGFDYEIPDTKFCDDL